MTIMNPSLPTIVIQIVFIIFCMLQPLVVYMISRVLKRLDDLNEKVRIQNGRVTTLEVWAKGHVSLTAETARVLEKNADKLSVEIDRRLVKLESGAV